MIQRNQQFGIFSEFELLKKRPGMFFPNKDVRYIIGYLSGAISVMRQLKCSLKKDLESLHQFYEYIYDKYSLIYKNGDRNYSYCELLILASNNDGEKAFDLFFELWDEFVKENNIVFEWDEVNE